MTRLSPAQRLAALVVVVVVVAAACVAYARSQLDEARARENRAPDVAVAVPSSAPVPGAAATTGADNGTTAAPFTGPRIVFRHTGLDSEYGVVASVPLGDPAGARTFSNTTCDRVDSAADGTLSCLTSERGVVTRFEALDVAPDGTVQDTTDLPGVPSRTRFSPDGTLVATTAFVTGHSYAATGFSTATVVRKPGGDSWGNLERFALDIDGKRVAPVDRNVWGVTFAPDDRTFYATVGTGGQTYLVRGDLRMRTLTSIATGVECPSLSPDGTKIGFKQVTASQDDTTTTWTPAVLDLESGTRTVLSGETRSVDDQLEWLDDATVLYGINRPDEPGTTDVWSLSTAPGAAPQRLIEQAWSPSIVR